MNIYQDLSMHYKISQRQDLETKTNFINISREYIHELEITSELVQDFPKLLNLTSTAFVLAQEAGQG